MDQNLLKAALRVLNAYATRTTPDHADVELLRRALPDADPRQAPDALAVSIVERELKVVRKRVSD